MAEQVTQRKFTQRIEEIVIEATPLEAMLGNLQWAITEASKFIERVVKDESASPETRLEAFREMVRHRDRVQVYAEKAAPYCHPRLHAVAPAPKENPAASGVEVDPLREHLEEMAKHFRLKATNGHAA